MQAKMTGHEYRTTVVCIDSYEQCVPAGRMYNLGLGEGEVFRSLMEFIQKMEDLLDRMKFPQPFVTLRSFQAPPGAAADSPQETERQEGKLATFAVRILFRQNASWQGSVTWLEGGREESFRSALELFLLMNSALQETG